MLKVENQRGGLSEDTIHRLHHLPEHPASALGYSDNSVGRLERLSDRARPQNRWLEPSERWRGALAGRLGGRGLPPRDVAALCAVKQDRVEPSMLIWQEVFRGRRRVLM